MNCSPFPLCANRNTEIFTLFTHCLHIFSWKLGQMLLSNMILSYCVETGFIAGIIRYSIKKPFDFLHFFYSCIYSFQVFKPIAHCDSQSHRIFQYFIYFPYGLKVLALMFKYVQREAFCCSSEI